MEKLPKKEPVTCGDMGFSGWKPLVGGVPSLSRKGEPTAAPIHTAVGYALSQWEHMESGLARLFQLLCESPAAALLSAYQKAQEFSLRAMPQAASSHK